MVWYDSRLKSKLNYIHFAMSASKFSFRQLRDLINLKIYELLFKKTYFIGIFTWVLWTTSQSKNCFVMPLLTLVFRLGPGLLVIKFCNLLEQIKALQLSSTSTKLDHEILRFSTNLNFIWLTCKDVSCFNRIDIKLKHHACKYQFHVFQMYNIF